HTDLSSRLQADATTLALDRFQSHLLVGTAAGEVHHWQVDEPDNPTFVDTFAPGRETKAGVSALGWLLGDHAVIVGDTRGGVSVWFQVRNPQNPQDAPFRQIHTLRPHSAPITAIAPSPRDKGFVTADATGIIRLHHSTSEQTSLELRTAGNPIPLLAFAPKADGVVAVDAHGQLYHW